MGIVFLSLGNGVLHSAFVDLSLALMEAGLGFGYCEFGDGH